MAIKKIHFVGIKGVGMSALAILAKEMGYKVSGSDVEEIFVTDKALEKAGIKVTGFDPKNLQYKPDLVVVSAAFGNDNLEVKTARKKRLDIKPYSEALAMFSQDSQVIAVAGVHGKTTTTAIISFLLKKANLDPSFIIGSGIVPSLGTNAHKGKGEYFILEADEYRKSQTDNDSKFLDLTPKIEVITSIEMDHPDMFDSEEFIYDAFYRFACRIPRNGFIVLCIDYPKSRRLIRSLADRDFETYGFQNGAVWKIVSFKELGFATDFSILNNAKKLGPFRIKIPGEANALNATAAIIVALKLGIDEKIIKKYLPNFLGVKRRFEKIGKINNINIYDDYAHHPRAIRMTLEAARLKFPDAKIWCIFQPHTYSRTKKLLNEFAKSFKSADKVIFTEIYSSAREKKATVTSDDLALATRQFQRGVKYISSRSKVVQEIIDNAEGSVFIITMGAGDVYKIGEEIFNKLKKKEK